MSLISGIGAQGSANFFGLQEGLKVIFEEPISNSLVQDSEVYDMFETDMDIPVKDSTAGRYIELAHYAADGGGFGARREGGLLPEASPPTIFNGRLNLRKNHMTVEMSGETMRRVKAGDSAWLSWAQEALPNATRRLRHHLDREALGYGFGVLGRVAAISSNILTIDRSFGLVGLTGAVLNIQRNDFLRAADDIFGTTLRSGAANRMRVTGVDVTANQITVDATSTGLIVGDFLFVGDNSDNSSLGGVGLVPKEMMGLLGIVDDGSVLATFQNQTRASTIEYRGIAVDAAVETQGEFNEDLLVKADDDAFVIGSGQPDFILGNRAQERAYWRNLRQDRGIIQAGPESLIDQGGKKRGFRILLNGRPVMFRVGRKVPPEVCFMVEKATLKRWQNGGGFSFDNTTGSLFERVVTSAGRLDAYYAVGTLEGELGCVMPRRNVIIKNINPAL